MANNLATELLKNAKPFFQIYRRLTGNCPNCNSKLVLKYRINDNDFRALSIILACSNNCDRQIWNTKATEGFTHWWLDGKRDKEDYERIISSLPDEERKLVKELESILYALNDSQKVHDFG